ncbi:hypothetical protein UFOVP704_2 [uncultured Caudovirales phage]|uniref:Uncharacterized protein n=1 Tax=uncultured Caudovirales phage TaxID=2100421 RepID=A0A6J5NI60_9CAUD|nr:hypothetical protein UFOVP704_2 [uncultured Caudovirales phage]
MSTPTFEYFVSRLTDDVRRIREGNANKYDFYETTSHHVDFTINNHRVALLYDLRINVATEELVLLDRIVVTANVILSSYEVDCNMHEPSTRKRHALVIKTTAESIEDQISEAVNVFASMLIKDVDIPPAQFDFWKYVAYAMPQFDKIVKSAVRDNSDFIDFA